jgi:chemotaxis methyl-accepting protein methylase/PAS domain-containing protein
MVKNAEALAGDFPIVGIGCSAGGLDALEVFFAHVPADCGMAFVVVQHLTPGHVSALPELLQRATRMTVAEAAEAMLVKPNCVYVIPPNRDISLLNGALFLFEPVEPRGLRLPIDFFLRTLAEDRGEKAIGIILSGMGSDGLFGLRAIKEKAGLTLAQEPSSAQADSMPSAVIEAGVVDIIAPPDELPARIVAFLKHPVQGLPAEKYSETGIHSDLGKIIILLRQRAGTDFSLYKTNTIVRRVERRIALHQFANIGEYLRYLRNNAQEIDLLFKELLIGVTNFFRDGAVWEYLSKEAIPELLARHPLGKPVRAWVPACSSGEEAYSLAITFKEAMETTKPSERLELQIYATDLDPDAIDKARKGVYPDNIAADVSPERLNRFFVKEGNSYRISKEIRETVIFATQNIISDPPFTKLDFLSCRNLLIYFRPQLQNRLLPIFHYALNPGSLLLLGSAETIGTMSELFIPISNKARLFKRLAQAPLLSKLEFPYMTAREKGLIAEISHADQGESFQQLVDQLIQQNYAPPAVLVNGEGDILYISGRTGKYLEPAAGKVNTNIHAMAREGLREALTGVIHKALREPTPIHLKGLKVGTNGGTQTVDLTIQALEGPEPLRGWVIIVFNDVTSTPQSRKKRKSASTEAAAELQLELQQTREALQATHEEMQTSLEELRSSNEELQSSNEELTTSKEEMQSLNEELQTVNAELQSKVDTLTWVQNDMANLLNSTEVATIFLDSHMKLRRFTSHATKIFKLLPVDIGRPLSDITSDINYPNIKDDAQEVLQTLAFQEKQIGAHDGRWFRVRIMPYRTQENVIDGVVITFIDISEIKKLQDDLASLTKRGKAHES